MQHLEGSGTPVLYIGHAVLKGQFQLNITLFWCQNFIQQLTCYELTFIISECIMWSQYLLRCSV